MAKHTETPPRGGGKRRLRTMAIAVITVLILYIAVSLIGSAIVFHILFGRNEEEPVSLEQRYEDVDPLQYPRVPVQFRSGDNTLQGYLYGEGGPLGTVVVVHGISDGADSHLAEALYFVDHGWTVFCFDGTGTRESEGSGTVGLSQMKLDLLAAIGYLTERDPDAPIVLYGHSQGAYAAAAVLDDRPDVRAAVCVSAFDTPVDIMYWHAERRVGPLAAIEYPFLCLHNYLLFGDEANESGEDAIRTGDTPVLIVYGSDDELVPADQSLYERFLENGDPNVTTVLIDEAPRNRHSTLWLTEDSAGYYQGKVQELSELHARCGPDIPRELADSFLRELDRERLCELDPDYMDGVQQFLLKAIA